MQTESVRNICEWVILILFVEAVIVKIFNEYFANSVTNTNPQRPSYINFQLESVIIQQKRLKIIRGYSQSKTHCMWRSGLKTHCVWRSGLKKIACEEALSVSFDKITITEIINEINNLDATQLIMLF